MKQIYQALLDVYIEMEEIMGKEGKAHHVSYAKEAVSLTQFLLYKLLLVYLTIEVDVYR